MDWSTFFTWIVQGVILFVLAMIVIAILVGTIRALRQTAPPKPPKRSWDGYYDESGKVPGKPGDVE